MHTYFLAASYVLLVAGAIYALPPSSALRPAVQQPPVVLTRAHHARQGGGASSSLHQHWRHRHAIVPHGKSAVPMACVARIVFFLYRLPVDRSRISAPRSPGKSTRRMDAYGPSSHSVSPSSSSLLSSP
jgi:hypothetical protein